MTGLFALVAAIARSIPGTAASAAVAAQTAAETAAANAETHNYAITVSDNTLVFTPPAEPEADPDAGSSDE